MALHLACPDLQKKMENWLTWDKVSSPSILQLFSGFETKTHQKSQNEKASIDILV